MDSRTLTVSKLIAHLQSFPGEMLVFDIDDYHGICEPMENSSSLPCVESVTEIEFQSTKRRCFHSGSRDSLVPHDVIRTIDVLAL